MCVAQARGARLDIDPTTENVVGDLKAANDALDWLVYRVFDGKHITYCSWSWKNGTEIVAEFSRRAT